MHSHHLQAHFHLSQKSSSLKSGGVKVSFPSLLGFVDAKFIILLSLSVMLPGMVAGICSISGVLGSGVAVGTCRSTTEVGVVTDIQTLLNSSVVRCNT